MEESKAFSIAYSYAKSRHRKILRQDSPGHGMEGRVWKTSVPSAVKVFYRPEAFQIELLCYQRLLENEVDQIQGLNVPVLEDFDVELNVIEITFVQPPYLLDFGKAALDIPPSYLTDERDLRRFQSQWKGQCPGSS